MGCLVLDFVWCTDAHIFCVAVMSCILSLHFLIRVCAGVDCNATDVFDSATGKWSTAELSVARFLMGAVSVGRFALFAGGTNVWGALQCRKRSTFRSDCVFVVCALICGWFAALSDVWLSSVRLFFHAQLFFCCRFRDSYCCR
jgi:hypothetical protein